MKKYLHIITTCLCAISVNSQVLYSETFSSYTLGNLGTDYTGVIPGQGGWLTVCLGNSTHINEYFKITNEPNKGNVLTLSPGTTTPTNVSIVTHKGGIDSFINQRTSGNNVLKIELDYYTGAMQTPPYYANQIFFNHNDSGNILNPSNVLFRYDIHAQGGEINVIGNDLTKNIKLDKNSQSAKLPSNTWITLIVYLDYNNKKAYFETPYFNHIAVGDFYKNSSSTI